MDIRSHIEALQVDGERLATAAASAGLDAKVPACPDWVVRDLLQHLSGVHRWAALNVTHGTATSDQTAAAFDPPDDDELLAWFRAGHASLGRALSEADPAVEAFTFLPAPSPLAFWARRQAHETAIHRADAESAGGRISAFPVEFAVDGIDELLGGFMSRSGDRLPVESPVSLGVIADDAGRGWTMRINPGDASCSPGVASPDRAGDATVTATVRGSASDLYLFLWNRLDRDAISFDGDPAVLDLWRDNANIRWS
jgi:uncharacterized protein (TIGR03083 family)